MLSWDTENTIDPMVTIRVTEENTRQGISSIGNQSKWKVGDKWVKEDMQGYEGLAEEFVSLLAEYIEGLDYIPYQTCYIKKDSGDRVIGCYCESMFRNDNEAFVTFHKLYEQHGVHFEHTMKRKSAEGRIRHTIDFIRDNYGVDVTNYLVDTLYLDRLTLNEDRHASNLGIIRNIETGAYKTAPIFDNGMSFLARDNQWGTMPIHVAIRKLKYRPFANKQLSALANISDRKLKMDKDKLDDRLKEYNNGMYPKRTVNNIRRMLMETLLETEGEVWVRI